MKSVRFDIPILVNLSSHPISLDSCIPVRDHSTESGPQIGAGISLSKVRKVVPAHTYILHPDRVLQVQPQLISCLLQGREVVHKP